MPRPKSSRIDEPAISILELLDIYFEANELYPVTCEWDDWYQQKYKRRDGVESRTQRHHMLGWHMGQMTTGFGQYTREEANYDAKKTYGRLLSVGGLLWMNEAVGQDPVKVQAACKAAQAEKDYRTRVKVLRQILPWSEFAVLAKAVKTEYPAGTAQLGDWDIDEFLDVFEDSAVHTPVIAKFEKAMYKDRAAAQGEQHDRAISWLASQLDPGDGEDDYLRINLSLHKAYLQCQDDVVLLWLLEACGISVRALISRIKKESDAARRCDLIRQRVPWETVVSHLQADF